MNVIDTWRGHFGDLQAVSHRLRTVLRQRWLRIHSLPESKRYAETDSEYTELLRRHNIVADEIIGTGEAILFAYAGGTANDFTSTFVEFEWATRSGLTNATPTEISDPDDEGDDVVVGGCRLHWSAGAWDDMLRDVADDRLSSIVLLNPRSGEVYAPYDGGADVFVANPERASALKDRWAAWLSAHPRGL